MGAANSADVSIKFDIDVSEGKKRLADLASAASSAETSFEKMTQSIAKVGKANTGLSNINRALLGMSTNANKAQEQLRSIDRVLSGSGDKFFTSRQRQMDMLKQSLIEYNQALAVGDQKAAKMAQQQMTAYYNAYTAGGGKRLSAQNREFVYGRDQTIFDANGKAHTQHIGGLSINGNDQKENAKKIIQLVQAMNKQKAQQTKALRQIDPNASDWIYSPESMRDFIGNLRSAITQNNMDIAAIFGEQSDFVNQLFGKELEATFQGYSQKSGQYFKEAQKKYGVRANMPQFQYHGQSVSRSRKTDKLSRDMEKTDNRFALRANSRQEAEALARQAYLQEQGLKDLKGAQEKVRKELRDYIDEYQKKSEEFDELDPDDDKDQYKQLQKWFKKQQDNRIRAVQNLQKLRALVQANTGAPLKGDDLDIQDFVRNYIMFDDIGFDFSKAGDAERAAFQEKAEKAMMTERAQWALKTNVLKGKQKVPGQKQAGLAYLRLHKDDEKTKPNVYEAPDDLITKQSVQKATAIQEAWAKTNQQMHDADSTSQKIMYHWGNLADISDSKKTHQLGGQVVAYAYGKKNGTSFGDGTGAYTTTDVSQYSKPGANLTSDPLRKINKLDVSKLNLFEENIQQRADSFFNFQHTLERYVMSKANPDFHMFDEELKHLTSDANKTPQQQLFEHAKAVMSNYSNVFDATFSNVEEFTTWLSQMVNLVQATGMDKNGRPNPQMLAAVNQKYGVDDVKTRFMKQLGFEGTNLTGTSYDSLKHGNVIYDVNNPKITRTRFESLDDAQQDAGIETDRLRRARRQAEQQRKHLEQETKKVEEKQKQLQAEQEKTEKTQDKTQRIEQKEKPKEQVKKKEQEEAKPIQEKKEGVVPVQESSISEKNAKDVKSSIDAVADSVGNASQKVDNLNSKLKVSKEEALAIINQLGVSTKSTLRNSSDQAVDAFLKNGKFAISEQNRNNVRYNTWKNTAQKIGQAQQKGVTKDYIQSLIDSNTLSPQMLESAKLALQAYVEIQKQGSAAAQAYADAEKNLNKNIEAKKLVKQKDVTEKKKKQQTQQKKRQQKHQQQQPKEPLDFDLEQPVLEGYIEPRNKDKKLNLKGSIRQRALRIINNKIQAADWTLKQLNQWADEVNALLDSEPYATAGKFEAISTSKERDVENRFKSTEELLNYWKKQKVNNTPKNNAKPQDIFNKDAKDFGIIRQLMSQGVKPEDIFTAKTGPLSSVQVYWKYIKDTYGDIINTINQVYQLKSKFDSSKGSGQIADAMRQRGDMQAAKKQHAKDLKEYNKKKAQAKTKTKTKSSTSTSSQGTTTRHQTVSETNEPVNVMNKQKNGKQIQSPNIDTSKIQAQIDTIINKVETGLSSISQTAQKVVGSIRQSLSALGVINGQSKFGYAMRKWGEADPIISKWRGYGKGKDSQRGAQQRMAFVNTKTGKITNEFLYDQDTSFSSKMYSAILKQNKQTLSMYNGSVHSHPNRTIEDPFAGNQQLEKKYGKTSQKTFSMSGYDLLPSKGDFSQWMKQMQSGLSQFFIQSGGQMAHFDFSKFIGHQDVLQKVIDEYDKQNAAFKRQLDQTYGKEGGEKNWYRYIADNGGFDKTKGTFDFSILSNLGAQRFNNALKTVIGDSTQFGNISDILKVDSVSNMFSGQNTLDLYASAISQLSEKLNSLISILDQLNQKAKIDIKINADGIDLATDKIKQAQNDLSNVDGEVKAAQYGDYDNVHKSQKRTPQRNVKDVVQPEVLSDITGISQAVSNEISKINVEITSITPVAQEVISSIKNALELINASISGPGDVLGQDLSNDSGIANSPINILATGIQQLSSSLKTMLGNKALFPQVDMGVIDDQSKKLSQSAKKVYTLRLSQALHEWAQVDGIQASVRGDRTRVPEDFQSEVTRKGTDQRFAFINTKTGQISHLSMYDQPGLTTPDIINSLSKTVDLDKYNGTVHTHPLYGVMNTQAMELNRRKLKMSDVLNPQRYNFSAGDVTDLANKMLKDKSTYDPRFTKTLVESGGILNRLDFQPLMGFPKVIRRISERYQDLENSTDWNQLEKKVGAWKDGKYDYGKVAQFWDSSLKQIISEQITSHNQRAAKSKHFNTPITATADDILKHDTIDNMLGTPVVTQEDAIISLSASLKELLGILQQIKASGNIDIKINSQNIDQISTKTSQVTTGHRVSDGLFAPDRKSRLRGRLKKENLPDEDKSKQQRKENLQKYLDKLDDEYAASLVSPQDNNSETIKNIKKKISQKINEFIEKYGDEALEQLEVGSGKDYKSNATLDTFKDMFESRKEKYKKESQPRETQAQQQPKKKKQKRQKTNTKEKQDVAPLTKATSVISKYEPRAAALRAKQELGVATTSQLKELQRINQQLELASANIQKYNEGREQSAKLTQAESKAQQKINNAIKAGEDAYNIQKKKSQQLSKEMQEDALIRQTNSQLQDIANRNIEGLDISSYSNKIRDLNISRATGTISELDYIKKTQAQLNKIRRVQSVVAPGTDSATARRMMVQSIINQAARKGQTVSERDISWAEKTSKSGAMTGTAKTTIVNSTGQDEVIMRQYDATLGYITKADTTLKKHQSTFEKFASMYKNKLLEMGTYLGSFVSIYQIWGALKQGVNTVKQFDTALTEMRKVSDESVTTLKSFQTESFGIADAVGTTALQIQQSTADFMRLGQSLDQAKKSAANASLLLNVSEFDSIDEATTSLIAMTQAFDDYSQEQILDSLNKVGNQFSISTKGLSVALQKSASALKTEGNDLAESIALLTAGNQVVQDPDSVGAAMKVISLRLAGQKQTLKEQGEDVDNMVETTSKLQEGIMNATRVASNNFQGIDIEDQNGNLRSTYDIILDIARVWEEIGESDFTNGTNKQAFLLQTMAGKMRSNVLASILQSPDVLQSSYQAAQNAEGSAETENQKFLQSIEGRQQVFQNKLQEVTTTLLDSSIVKWVVDSGSAVLGFIDSLVSGIGSVGTAITGLVAGKGVASFFKNFDTLAALGTKAGTEKDILKQLLLGKAEGSDIGKVFADVVGKGLVDATSEMSLKDAEPLFKKVFGDEETSNLFNPLMENFEEFKEALANDGGIIQNIKSKLADLKNALVGVAKGAITHPLITAGVVGVTAIIAGITLYNRYKQAMIDTANTATSNWNNSKSSLQEYISQYTQLKMQLESGDLSEQEQIGVKQQILDLQKQIVQQYGAQASGIDLVNGKLSEQINQLNAISQNEAIRNIAENNSAYEDAMGEMQKQRAYTLFSGYDELNDTQIKAQVDEILGKYQGFVKDYDPAKVTGGVSGFQLIDFKGTASEAHKVFTSIIADLNGIKNVSADQAPILQSLISQANKAEEEVSGTLNDYQANYDAFVEQTMYANGGGNKITGLSSAISNYNTALLGSDQEAIDRARQNYREAEVQMSSFLGELMNSGKVAPQMNQGLLEFFASMQEELNKTQLQYHDFTEMLSDTMSGEQFDEGNMYASRFDEALQKVAKDVKGMDLDEVDIKQMWDVKGTNEQQDAVRSLAEAFGLTKDLWGSGTAQAESKLRSFINALVQAGLITGQVAAQAATAQEELGSVWDDQNLTDIQEATQQKELGDNYDAYVKNLKRAKELRESGDVGTKEFKALAKSFSPSGSTGWQNFDQNRGDAESWFSGDETQDITNFLNEMEQAGFATQDEAGEWNLGVMNLGQAAKKTVRPVQQIVAMLGLLNDKGFDVTAYGNAQQAMTGLKDKTIELSEAQQQLTKMKKLQQQGDGDYTLAISEQQKYVQRLRGQIATTSEMIPDLVKEQTETAKQQAKVAGEYINQMYEQYKAIEDDASIDEETKQAVLNNMEEQIRSFAQQNGLTLDITGATLTVDKNSAQIQKTKDAIDAYKKGNQKRVAEIANQLAQREYSATREGGQSILSKLGFNLQGVNTENTQAIAQAITSQIGDVGQFFKQNGLTTDMQNLSSDITSNASQNAQAIIAAITGSDKFKSYDKNKKQKDWIKDYTNKEDTSADNIHRLEPDYKTEEEKSKDEQDNIPDAIKDYIHEQGISNASIELLEELRKQNEQQKKYNQDNIPDAVKDYVDSLQTNSEQLHYLQDEIKKNKQQKWLEDYYDTQDTSNENIHQLRNKVREENAKRKREQMQKKRLEEAESTMYDTKGKVITTPLQKEQDRINKAENDSIVQNTDSSNLNVVQQREQEYAKSAGNGTDIGEAIVGWLGDLISEDAYAAGTDAIQGLASSATEASSALETIGKSSPDSDSDGVVTNADGSEPYTPMYNAGKQNPVTTDDQMQHIIDQNDELLNLNVAQQREQEYAESAGEGEDIGEKFIGWLMGKDTHTQEETETATESPNKAEPTDIDVSDQLSTIRHELAVLSQGGNVDLNNRPIISASKLNESGYNAGDGQATVFSSTYSNEAGNVAINFTPILPDGTVMEPGAFQQYCESVVAGAQDDKQLQIGAPFYGDDAINQAVQAAEQIHQAHQQILNMGTGTETNLGQISQPYQPAEQVTTPTEQDLKVEASMTLKPDQAISTFNTTKSEIESDTIEVPMVIKQTTESSGGSSNNGGEGKQQPKEESVSGKITMDSSSVDQATDKVTELQHKQIPDKGFVVKAPTLPTAVQQLQEAARLNIPDKSFSVNTDGAQSALSQIQSIAAEVNRIPNNKTVNITVNKSSSGGSNSVQALGTAHPMGTALSRAYASGTNFTVGKNETALVNEVGMESRVHNGKWELLPGGPHVEKLDKNDIIFNAQQTQDLIRSGKTARRGKIVGGAHFDGTVDDLSLLDNSDTYIDNTDIEAFWGGTAAKMSVSNDLSLLDEPDTYIDNVNTEAFWRGTIPGMPAHAYEIGSGAGKAKADASAKASSTGSPWTNKNNGSNGNDSQQAKSKNDNTDATNKNTKATKENTKKKKEEGQVFDWISSRLSYLADQTSKFADAITDFVSYSDKMVNLIGKIDKNGKTINATDSYNRSRKGQLSSILQEIAETRQGANRYWAEAKNVKAPYSSKTKKKSQKSANKKFAETKKMIDAGYVINIETIKDSNLATAISNYQQYADSARQAANNVQNLQRSLIELYSTWAKAPAEEAEKQIERLTKGLQGLEAAQARLDALGKGGSTQSILDRLLGKGEGTGSQYRNLGGAGFTAFAQDNANKTSYYKKAWQESKKALQRLRDNYTDYINYESNRLYGQPAIVNVGAVSSSTGTSTKTVSKKTTTKKRTVSKKSLKSTGKSLAKKYKSKLSKKQQTALKKGNKVSLGNTKGKLRTKLKDYNKQVTEYQSYDSADTTSTITKKQVKKAGKAVAKKYSKPLNKKQQKRLEKGKTITLTKKQKKNTKLKEAVKKQNNLVKARKAQQAAINSGKAIAKKYAKTLTKQQQKDLKAGKSITLTKDQKKNKKLAAAIKKHNASVKTATTATEKSAKITAKKQATPASDIVGEYKQGKQIFDDAVAEAQADAVAKAAEYAAQKVQEIRDNFDYLTEAYETQLKYQESVNKLAEQNIADAETFGDQIKAADRDLQENNLAINKQLKEQEASNLQKILDAGVKNGTIQENSKEWLEMTEQINAAKSAAHDYGVQIKQTEIKKLEDIVNHYSKIIDSMESILSLTNAMKGYDFDDAVNNYKQASYYADNISAKEKIAGEKWEEASKEQVAFWQMAGGKGSAYQVGTDSYIQKQAQINKLWKDAYDARADVAKLSAEQIQYEIEQWTRAIDKQDKFIDNLNTIGGLMNDAAKWNYDTGDLTEQGQMSMVIDKESYTNAVNDLQAINEEREKLQKKFREDANYGQQAYDEDLENLVSRQMSALNSAKSALESFTKTVETTAQKQLEALNKVINKRKEALQKQKEMHDYDKQLKNSNKEIALLEAQSRALEGVADAESKAMKARIDAQIQQKREALQDTTRDHAVSLQTQGLSDLQEKLQENYERWSQEFEANAQKQLDVMKSTNMSTTQLNAQMTQLLSTYGTNMSQLNITTGQTSTNLSALKGSFNAFTKDTSAYDTAVKGNEDLKNKLVASWQGPISQALATKLTEEFAKITSAGEASIVSAIGVTNANLVDNGTNLIKRVGDRIGTTDSGLTKSVQKVAAGIAAQAMITQDNTIPTITGKIDEVIKAINSKNSASSSSSSSAKKSSSSTSATKAKNTTSVEMGINGYLYKVTRDSKGKVVSTLPLSSIAPPKFPGSMQYGGKARGSLSINKDDRYLTQEKGGEIITTKDGVLIPLKAGDGVVPAQLTEKLFEMARNYPDLPSASNVQIPNIPASGTRTNLTVSYGSLLTVNGNVDKEVLPSLKTILQESYQYTQKKLAQDAMKAGMRRTY